MQTNKTMAQIEKEKNKRFAPYSKENLKDLTKQVDSISTKRVIDRSKRLFHEFLRETSVKTEISDMSPEFLNSEVELFIASIRKLDGEDLKKKSLDSIKYGLSKYLLNDYNIDLAKSDYSGIMKVYKAKVKQLKKIGKGSVDHKVLIDISDIERLNYTECVPFNPSTPCGLQNRVWFMLMWYLIRRGQENLRTMTKSTFGIGVNGSGRRYVEQIVDEADKNHGLQDVHPDATIGEGKMYEWKDGNPNCPVKLFEKYLSKLNPKCNALWQRPLDTYNPNSEVWYCNASIGKNGLANFMPNISRQGNLSKVYTNHCLRATAIKYLDEAGVEARHIKRVSGHMSIASIESYAQRLSENKREEINDKLSEPFATKTAKPATATNSAIDISVSKAVIPATTATSPAVNISDMCTIDFGDMFNKENEFPEMLQDQPVSIQVQRQEQSFRQLAPIFNITNCVVTFNQGSN